LTQRELDLKRPPQFDEALISLTNAVTALANYTHALKKVSAKERSIEGSHALDRASSVDILEKVTTQLTRATDEVRSLYAHCGIAEGNTVDWTSNTRLDVEVPAPEGQESRRRKLIFAAESVKDHPSYRPCIHCQDNAGRQWAQANDATSGVSLPYGSRDTEPGSVVS